MEIYNIYYEYDELDNLISNTDPLENQICLNDYDSLGNLLSTVDALGRTTSCQYDVMNRLETTTNPLNNSTLMFYNENGQLTTVQNAMGDSSRQSYDKNGNIASDESAVNKFFNAVLGIVPGAGEVQGIVKLAGMCSSSSKLELYTKRQGHVRNIVDYIR